MGYIPIHNQSALKAMNQRSFFGINRSEKSEVGEFFDMKNISFENYPYLSSRKPREKCDVLTKIFVTENGEIVEREAENIRAVIAPREGEEILGFSGVAGTDFYYNGVKKNVQKEAVYDNYGNFKYGMEIALDGKIQLLWANQLIIIHGYDCSEREPYIYYYNTKPADQNKDFVSCNEYKNPGDYAEHQMKLNADGTGTIVAEYEASILNADTYWSFKEGDSVFVDGMMKYADSRWDTFERNDIISAIVKKYREEGIMQTGNYVRYRATITIEFFNQRGEAPFQSVGTQEVYHIYKKIPPMTHIALHKGRIWGANPNGEYVYASAFGDLFDFSVFENLSSDSVYLESASHGGYKGVISCGDAVVTMKKNEMEVIYGELPNEFTVGKSYTGCGCSDISSCVVIDNILYFLNERGFHMWNGSRPQLISKVLNGEYKSALGYTDGVGYYVSAELGSGKRENLVYDTRYRLWGKEDHTKISSAFSYDGETYILIGDNIYEKNRGNEKVLWYAESVRLFFGDEELKRVNEIVLKAKMSKETIIRIYISHNGGEWRECPLFYPHKEGYRTFRVPVRLFEGQYWQYKIEGMGDAIIMGVKIYDDKGGVIYSNEREDAQ